MTYEEARQYTKTIGKTGSILGLASIEKLMHELGDIQEELSVFHIAGTNGKGSVGTYLFYALREAGYTVGRYTSPAVFEPLEVWQINGENISIENYTRTLSQVKAACDVLVSKGMPHPTVFEVETAVAFLYFYQKKCDYVILETGMGGRTDATNLISHPFCSVITSVSMDHMQFLGNSLAQIADAKAGIIKKGCPVVTVRQKPEVMEVIEKEAKEKNAAIYVAKTTGIKVLKQSPYALQIKLPAEQNVYSDRNIRIQETDGGIDITTHMTGNYQIENASLAVKVLTEVAKLPVQTIQKGMEKALWPGRFEVLLKEPLFVIDGAHNEDAAEKLRKTIENYFTNRRITYIIGVLADKEHDKMLQKMLFLADKVYTVTPANPRALDGRKLAKEALKYHSEVTACDSVGEAVESAMRGADAADVIVAFGSLSYLGEVRQCIGKYGKMAE